MQNISLTSVTELVEKNNIIFGPIHSRRFGVSLGIDLSPAIKQCNFDCLYCELAPSATTDTQSQILEVDTIIEALKEHLDDSIDVITLTANGEPTLYPYLYELISAIDEIKGNTQTLILTNSATLSDAKVFDALLQLDQVKLSLDAITPEIFKKIDRPHSGINIEEIAQKVIAFSKSYKGKLFIEILFVDGLNNTPQEIEKLNSVLLDVNATRIDIGTIDRPPAYPVKPISYHDLHQISLVFDARLPIHIASRAEAKPHPHNYSDAEIINTLDKRPLTRNDMELLFDKQTQQRFEILCECGEIVSSILSGVEFFIPAKNQKRKRHS